MESAAAIIPARLASSRFPEKPLAKIQGKEMILWVAELTAKAVGACHTWVATDSTKIASVVEEAGFQFIMTSPDALTGTDRIAEAARSIDADIYVNVQGDEPLLNPHSIRKVIKYARDHPGSIVNGFAPLSPNEDPRNPNIPICAISEDNSLLYMTRTAIPSFKDPRKERSIPYFKQVCIYAFRPEHLELFSSCGRKSKNEQFEDIEILRFLDFGYTVKMVKLPGDTIAVDTPEDLRKVEQILKAEK